MISFVRSRQDGLGYTLPTETHSRPFPWASVLTPWRTGHCVVCTGATFVQQRMWESSHGTKSSHVMHDKQDMHSGSGIRSVLPVHVNTPETWWERSKLLDCGLGV